MPAVGSPSLEGARNPFDSSSSASPSNSSVTYLSPSGIDDGAQIIAACNALNVLGGGELHFTGGAFTIYSVATSYQVLGAFTNCKGLRLISHGATFNVDPARIFTNDGGRLFTFTGCHNVHCEGFDVVGTGVASDTAAAAYRGLALFHFYPGNSNVSIHNNRLSGMGALAISYNQDGSGNFLGPVNEGFTVSNNYLTNCYYGVNGQFGPDHMTIDNLASNTHHRILFAWGLRGLDATLFSENPKDSDVLIGPHSQRPFFEDFDIHYTSVNTTAATDGAPRIHIRYWGLTTLGAVAAQTIKNGHLDYDLIYPAGQQSGAEALRIEKDSDGSGTADVLDRGHIFENIEVSGAIVGTPHAFVNILSTSNECAWGAGDFWRNITFRDLYINSANGAANLNLGSLSGPLLMENVVSNTAFGLWSTVSTSRVLVGQAKISNCSLPNLYAASGGFAALLVFNFGGGAFTLPVGWSGGMTQTNTGAGASDTTWRLPPAVPGLSYPFIRTDVGLGHIDPDGAEVIRGGGAGKYLSLDTAPGGGVTVICFVAGLWEITGVGGAISYEP